MRGSMWTPAKLIALFSVIGRLSSATNLSGLCSGNQDSWPNYYGPHFIYGGWTPPNNVLGFGECGILAPLKCGTAGFQPQTPPQTGQFGPVYGDNGNCVCGTPNNVIQPDPGASSCGNGASCLNGQCTPISCSSNEVAVPFYNDFSLPGGSGPGYDLECQCGLYISGAPLDSSPYYTGDCSCPSGVSLMDVDPYWDNSRNRYHIADCECGSGSQVWMYLTYQGRIPSANYECLPNCPANAVLDPNGGSSPQCLCTSDFWGPSNDCQQCPAGCGQASEAGCICGPGTVFLPASNSVFECEAPYVKTMNIYSGSTYPTAAQLCKCPQYTLSLPDGTQECIASCSGNLFQVSGMDCSCPTGTIYSSTNQTCACPLSASGVPQYFEEATMQCASCPGQSSVSPDGTSCECVPGAAQNGEGICACSTGYGIGSLIDGVPQCIQCQTGEILGETSENTYQCVCDLSQGYIIKSGAVGSRDLLCQACPSDAQATDNNGCQCNNPGANFQWSTWTCVTCSSAQYWNGEECVACPAGAISSGQSCQYQCKGANTQGTATGCECIPGYAPDQPGDTSLTLSCTTCASGFAVNYLAQQCSPCSIGNGVIIANSTCQCDLAGGYGIGGYGGSNYFTCQLCPANSEPSMQMQVLPAQMLPGCYCSNSADYLYQISSSEFACGPNPTCLTPDEEYVPGVGCTTPQNDPCPPNASYNTTSGTCDCGAGFTYDPDLNACVIPCPANSEVDGGGICRCVTGWAPASPQQTDPPTCVKCASNQIGIYAGCVCTSTNELGPCQPQSSGNPHRRRQNVQRLDLAPDMLFCGENEVWCPHEIAAERPTSVSGGKCINANSVTTCGGCNTGPFGLGVDCGDIEDVDQVRCVMGRCVVESCLSGEPSSDGSQCVGSKK